MNTTEQKSISFYTCTIRCVDCSKKIHGSDHEGLQMAQESAIGRAEHCEWGYYNGQWRCVTCSEKYEE